MWSDSNVKLLAALFKEWRKPLAEKRVEEYANKHGLSHNAAKRRMKSHRSVKSSMPVRGIPVAGTGKPKGAQKG